MNSWKSSMQNLLSNNSFSLGGLRRPDTRLSAFWLYPQLRERYSELQSSSNAQNCPPLPWAINSQSETLLPSWALNCRISLDRWRALRARACRVVGFVLVLMTNSFRVERQVSLIDIYMIQFLLRKMNRYAHLRAVSHEIGSLPGLSQEQETAHPQLWLQIVLLAVPLVLSLIIVLSLLRQVKRVIHNYFTKTYPTQDWLIINRIVSWLGLATVGIYAVVEDAWTTKEWILFAATLILYSMVILFQSCDSDITIIISTIFLILAAVANTWFFIELRDMPENKNDNTSNWKHATRNIVSWNQGGIVFFVAQLFGIWAVHLFGASKNCEVVFFWILGPILTVGVFVWLLLSYGPVLDLIGYIIISVILYLASILKILFYSQDEQSK